MKTTPTTLKKQAKAIVFLTLCAAAGLQISCAQPGRPVYGPAPLPHPASYPVHPVAMPAPPPAQLAPAPSTQTLTSVGRTVQLSIKDRASGKALPVYLHQGEYWVAGVPGQSYAITLASNMDRRVLATTSVDGINIVSGETAGTVQRGYVLSPFARYDIAGWRKSEHEIAAFNFATPSASYAAQTGRPANVGVIGVAVFPELYVPPPPPAPPIYVPPPMSRKDQAGDDASKRAMPMGAAPAMQAAPALGTQHGAIETSHSSTVSFQRDSNAPAEVITLRYDSVPNLVARGVLRWVQGGYAVNPSTPNPFPAHPQNGGFVPDPPRQR